MVAISYIGSLEQPGLCGFRLTTESGVPLSTSNRTAQTNLYLTPNKGATNAGKIAFKINGRWQTLGRGEATLSLSGKTANTIYDVFVRENSGSLAMEDVAWSSGTARATALGETDSIYTKSGASERLWVGCYRTTGTTGQTEFSFSNTGSARKLYVWNQYNQMDVDAKVYESTDSWSNSTTAWSRMNGSSNNRIEAVFGIAPSFVRIKAKAIMTVPVSSNGAVGVGLDSDSANSAGIPGFGPGTGNTVESYALFEENVAIGFHYFQALEARSLGSGTLTFYGDAGSPTYYQAGIMGTIKC